MTAIAQIPGGLTWDDDDRLQSSGHVGGGTVYYVYDGAGQRVRKVTVNQSGSTSKQRLYFGSWETYREHTSSCRAANSAIEVSEKRYRYTGQERDEETGLAYPGARYYAPWLGRWTAADPIGLGDGPKQVLIRSCQPQTGPSVGGGAILRSL